MGPSLARIVPSLLLPLLAVTLACGTQSVPSASTPPEIAPTEQVSYRYDNLPDVEHTSASFSHYQSISQWDKVSLTYYFVNGTNQIGGEHERVLVRQAFDLWAAQTPLTFTEVNSPTQADILVSWESRNHGDGDPFDGPGDVLAHASYPNPYAEEQVILHFDDDERWVDSTTEDVDLLTVAAHEIGHNLGLDHSSDPNSLLYPSYDGPRRYLGQDDINGIQSLYGAASETASSPEVPPSDAKPPSSPGKDSDGDGISDTEEIFRTGTDPNKADSDNDGLDDGIEVYYGMNPLDPDMDKDGVSDGQEVEDGTDPLFPDQEADVSDELYDVVGDFLTHAIQLQIEAYAQGDPTIAAPIMSGTIYESLKEDIDLLNQQGVVSISEINYYESFIDDVRVINDSRLEVDSCEVWSSSTYRLSDGVLVDFSGPTLLPQTITLKKMDTSWFITDVQFFDAPAFCN